MQLGIDVGYGYTKVVADNGRRTVFPSLVTLAPRGDLTTIAGRSVRYRLRLVTKGSSTDLLVGNAALLAGAHRDWGDHAADRAGYANLVLAAAAACGAEGAIDVGLGLPLSVYFQKSERDSLREAMRGLMAWVSLDGTEPRRISITDVHVYPQGFGAYVTSLRDNPSITGQAAGVIDVGFRTTDYLLLQPIEGASMPDESRSGSVDAGIGQALNAIRGYIARTVGASFDPPEGLIEDAVRRGNITVRNRDIDLRQPWSQALDALAYQVTTVLRRVWGEQLNYLAVIILAGGGGEALRQRITDARLIPDPLYANAAGFLQLTGGPMPG